MDIIIIFGYIVVALFWIVAIQREYAESEFERNFAFFVGLLWLPFSAILVLIFLVKTLILFPLKAVWHK